ncbi:MULTISPECIES: UDP-N-acetylmuramoyl-tripeptide--D-alanyl-D-alanine ligase [Thermoactinomyces]|jgi:UDP-N-acetylmuramoyl-tripeptide--D-alanyl-D-alanine ligase|uniref:UDP-N-acetylmuramoyl-tripeptide--D-alanyl-D-alanine ligase n=1 Tax=Thermoactinomyces daqus TaxID=1329516 RepID=A0A7W1X9J4_9BACL|nr:MULTISPECIES: UDP-N-acetylmuramoyl-tripeptide--D-alanyl-D-alanine ligase [Thermoactinomyces]MBA4542542.1 UDP-N-acetylmuramoyl-tripeptide--D-alanyl-D-alanine ligase [Thermoactinomyces daqus]MBH8603089.1 UDP-N-acetylmuramoyl-tripeptide--D-alanyl-D-alanine ligase [Thermoactinomyces sp. CICC 10522]MBH8607104.1 UDP-N-acetylmuramoyl-tripeptide--D-alanyl-D-alanine ligase [Thermoactinomyces sp. CICC 10521]
MIERTCDWIIEVTGGTWAGNAADRHRMIRGVSTDTRQLEPNQLYVPLCGERFDGHRFIDDAIERGAAAALWSQDRPVPENREIPFILVPEPLLAMQQLAARYREESGVKVVAVTGSNGKTTTKDLIATVLSVKYHVHKTKGNLNNHIGVPLTLLSMPEQTETAVVEMGMNHAGEIEVLSRIARPDVAVITNIGESHLEHLGSREGIAKAKLEIKEGLKENGPLIFDGDEPLLRQFLKEDHHPQIRVGWGEESDESPVDVQIEGVRGMRFRSRKYQTEYYLPLMGRHNVKNSLLAVEVGRYLGMAESEIQEGLAAVKLTGMRLELKQAANGMKIIDDSYNASPTSMRAALDLLSELEPGLKKWALLGDMREIGPEEKMYHTDLGVYAVKKGIDRLYTLGERGKWIGEGAKSAVPVRPIVIDHFDTIEEASDRLNREGNGDILLLVKASRAVELDRVIKKLTEGE